MYKITLRMSEIYHNLSQYDTATLTIYDYLVNVRRVALFSLHLMKTLF